MNITVIMDELWLDAGKMRIILRELQFTVDLFIMDGTGVASTAV